ncbi:MAG TPA: hypothetical protein PLP29_08095 [Candidatus Ozemobacteraceae bacterium]|nr:hypothetical protein [Candidatus Ozemobacteraceae bacterium]
MNDGMMAGKRVLAVSAGQADRLQAFAAFLRAGPDVWRNGNPEAIIGAFETFAELAGGSAAPGMPPQEWLAGLTAGGGGTVLRVKSTVAGEFCLMLDSDKNISSAIWTLSGQAAAPELASFSASRADTGWNLAIDGTSGQLVIRVPGALPGLPWAQTPSFCSEGQDLPRVSPPPPPPPAPPLSHPSPAPDSAASAKDAEPGHDPRLAAELAAIAARHAISPVAGLGCAIGGTVVLAIPLYIALLGLLGETLGGLLALPGCIVLLVVMIRWAGNRDRRRITAEKVLILDELATRFPEPTQHARALALLRDLPNPEGDNVLHELQQELKTRARP